MAKTVAQLTKELATANKRIAQLELECMPPEEKILKKDCHLTTLFKALQAIGCQSEVEPELDYTGKPTGDFKLTIQADAFIFNANGEYEYIE